MPSSNDLKTGAQQLWEGALEALRNEGNAYAVSQLMQLEPMDLSNGELKLGVGDRFFRDWVDDHYRPMIDRVLERLAGSTVQLRYEVIDRPRPTELVAAAVTQVRVPVRLNERFTFETYVVADSNQLPAAAATAVADAPGKAYNPLFIYGGTGLGKTHLLHAVGNRILQRDAVEAHRLPVVAKSSPTSSSSRCATTG